MSYQLTHQSTQTTRTFSRQFWLKALELARDYGWKPSGICPPPNFDFYTPIAEWDGRYLTNDGQTVKKAGSSLLKPPSAAKPRSVWTAAKVGEPVGFAST